MTGEPIKRSPITEMRLRQDLADIGLEAGMTLIVHSSLKSIGWVVGGAPTVIRALLDAIGVDGTLVMPAATPQCSEPATGTQPQDSECRLEQVVDSLPVFDPLTTPTMMGAIAESFRTWPGTLRSEHPLESVSARGVHAGKVTKEHPLSFSEGPGSPFAKVHELEGWILLLGVGFNRCTVLHFAESLVERRRTMTVRFPVVQDGRRTWTEVTNVADDNDTHFPIIGEKYLATGRAICGTIGESPSILLPMRDLVAFAQQYFEAVL